MTQTKMPPAIPERFTEIVERHEEFWRELTINAADLKRIRLKLLANSYAAFVHLVAFPDQVGEIERALKAGRRRTNFTTMNWLIKACTGAKTNLASYLAKALKFALSQNIAVDAFEKFVLSYGTEADCIEAYDTWRKSNAPGAIEPTGKQDGNVGATQSDSGDDKWSADDGHGLTGPTGGRSVAEGGDDGSVQRDAAGPTGQLKPLVAERPKVAECLDSKGVSAGFKLIASDSLVDRLRALQSEIVKPGVGISMKLHGHFNGRALYLTRIIKLLPRGNVKEN